MMSFYLLNASKLPDPKEDERVLSGIPEGRRRYILSYTYPRDRRLSLGAWRLMEETLERYGACADQVVIGINGKPECKGIFFNLSHSADMVLCAVGDVPTGCDIEKVTDPPLEVAERVFTQQERRYITNTNDIAKSGRRFFKLWTMKESYMKMTGEGMNLSPERLEIYPDKLTVFKDGIIQPCELQSITLEDYEISVCQSKTD